MNAGQNEEQSWKLRKKQQVKTNNTGNQLNFLFQERSMKCINFLQDWEVCVQIIINIKNERGSITLPTEDSRGTKESYSNHIYTTYTIWCLSVKLKEIYSMQAISYQTSPKN